MKMKVERSRIVILPENEQDKAYIEDTLGFKEEKEAIPCKGVALMGGTSIHSVFGDKRHEGKQRVKRRLEKMRYIRMIIRGQRRLKFKEIVNRIKQCLHSPIAMGKTGFLRINGFMVKIERVL